MTRNQTVVLLGLGMQGKAALHDLLNHPEIGSIIVAEQAAGAESYLERYGADRVTLNALDAQDESALIAMMKRGDVVVDALPGRFAFYLQKLAAENGVNLVSSMYSIDPGEEDPDRVAELRSEYEDARRKAASNGAVILTEFGMDPGIDLIMGAHALKEFSRVDRFFSYGGGFPTKESATNLLNYKFSWSPIGVMMSYRRPAVLKSRGEIVHVEAGEIFSSVWRRKLDVPELGGRLECFPNGNSLVYANHFGIADTVQDTGRYACRWPGHGDFWRIMSASGFLDLEPIRVGDQQISPQSFTASLLQSRPDMFYTDTERDIAILRVEIEGIKEGKPAHVVYQVIDFRDLTTGFSAMQRTVGYTLSLGARLILNGDLFEPGIHLPMDVPFEILEADLRRHGIVITRHEREVDEHRGSTVL